jgi:meiotic recombination protein REC8
MIDFNNDNDLPELGRDAPSALPDAPSSAIMPWNLSASLHSQQRSHASSTHAHSQGPTRNHNRNASASPLIGRGSALPSPFHVDVDEQDEILYGRSDAGSAHNQNDDGDDGFVHERTSSEFELHGAAANVDTQTAASSQWVRAVLEKDSGNFWAFVRGFVVERYQLIDAHDNEQGVDGKEVLFEELFEPERNSAAVAAQAFYHVLCLASKGKLGVRQEVGRVEEWGAFGEIGISVVV